MFETLRVRVAIRQSLTLGVMLIIVLTLILSYNITRLSGNIESKLEEMVNARYYNFIAGVVDKEWAKKDTDRDTLAIYIDNENNTRLSNIVFYDSETVKQLIEIAMEEKSTNGRMKIQGNYIAYALQSTALGTFIYVYDYTKDYENLRNMMVIIIIAGALGMVAITMFSFHSAKKSVEPIENAFMKQQELVANASHELKTPLTIINTDLSILNSGRESMTPEQEKWLDSINNQVGRMSNLVTEMLELAKIEASREKQLREPVNLSEVTEGAVLGSEVLAFEHNIDFVTEIKSNVIINAVPAHIEKLIYILLENALKYTDEGGSVTVTVESERKKAMLKVRNTGDGIARENLPKLFDRFYRTDESHTAANSFGLGLAIAKSIVDTHGGTIGVDSKVGEYTEFIVIFRQFN